MVSFFAVGFVLQQALAKRRPATAELRRKVGRGRNEIERHALKAQRGDYGKLEVIPFK